MKIFAAFFLGHFQFHLPKFVSRGPAAQRAGETLLGHDVHHGELSRQLDRVIVAKNNHRNTKFDAFGSLKHQMDHLKWVGDGDIVDDVMFGNPHLVVAKLIGQYCLLDQFVIELACTLAVIHPVTGQKKPKFHRTMPRRYQSERSVPTNIQLTGPA